MKIPDELQHWLFGFGILSLCAGLVVWLAGAETTSPLGVHQHGEGWAQTIRSGIFADAGPYAILVGVLLMSSAIILKKLKAR